MKRLWRVEPAVSKLNQALTHSSPHHHPQKHSGVPARNWLLPAGGKTLRGRPEGAEHREDGRCSGVPRVHFSQEWKDTQTRKREKFMTLAVPRNRRRAVEGHLGSTRVSQEEQRVGNADRSLCCGFPGKRREGEAG